MSDSVRTGLPGQLQSGIHADVCIRFHLERTPEEQQRQQQQQQQQQDPQQEQGQRGAEGAEKDPAAAGLRLVGDPLPAHKVILTLGSTFLRTKLESKCWQGGSAAGADQAARTRATGAAVSGECEGLGGDGTAGLPEVLVPLSSEDEEPFAREALKYIYTGSLSAGLDFEALLRVRQQACYLCVKHCPQACDQAMLAWLQAGEGQGQQQQPEGEGTSAVPPAAEAPVLQAYACHALFPGPETEGEPASFQLVRSALAKQLVSHFGDAVAALTRPDLYQQLLQLPAVAVRELLAADDFGTDSEDSVFLLLAAWLDAHKREEAATRAELCGLVRLHRLADTYLHHVLPVFEPFDISREELGFVFRYARGPDTEKAQVLAVASKRQASPWYCSPARRQVVPEEGRTVEWSISREQLEQGLREMVEGKGPVQVRASSCTPRPALAGDGPGMRVLSCGMLWRIALVLDPAEIPLAAAAGAAAAGLILVCDVPQQLGRLSGLADTNVRVAVLRCKQGKRKVGFDQDLSKSTGQCTIFGMGRGWATGLKLLPAAAAASGAGVGGGGDSLGRGQAGAQQQEAAGGVEAEVAAQLARWSEWLHEGKITGIVTFCKP